MHQKNQWDANRDIPRGKVADLVITTPKLGTPVIQKADHWHTEKDVPVEDPPQTRYQKKQWDAKSDIPPGVVQLSPFGQKEFFTDSKEEWPSSPHGSSPKKTWTGRGFSTSGVDDNAGVKRTEGSLDSPSRQLHIKKVSQRRGTSPSTERVSSPGSSTHAEPAEPFFEDKSSAPYQSKQLDTNKDIPRGKVRGMANLFGGSPTKESATDFESGPIADNFIPPSQASTQRSIAEKAKLDDDGFLRKTPSNEGLDPWILQMTPSSQLFPADESKWGASVTKSPESNDWESGKDWFQSTSFGNDTKGADEESTLTDKTTESKSQAPDVKAATSEPLSSNDALTQESSLAGIMDPATSQMRDLLSLTAKPGDETCDHAEVEKEDTMEEATKGKKRRGFFNLFGGVSSFWTHICWARDVETCLLT
jgi:hypothetical protein